MTERSVFLAAIDIGDSTTRSAYLDRACAGNSALRTRVEVLLAAAVVSDSFLAEPHALDDSVPAGTSPPATDCGLHIPGYEIVGELGRGGIGVVYKARHAALNRTVAVKIVSGTASTATLVRFRQEAEAVARLQHPNIVQVFEVGTCPAGAYLVLEYVDGGTLRERVAGVPQPPRDAARAVETLARAAHHAHERRLVHRDLKPSNVLLTSGGVLKVADFGLARSLDGGHGVTVTTGFVGTPAYAAPEQVTPQFAPVGPGTDVYSLGVVLYELVTGRVPFDGVTVARILRRVSEEEPAPPSRLKRDCPRDLETICLKCLQKEPRKRYRSAAELADDLRRFVAGEPISARPVGTLERAARWCRRNRAVATLLGTVFTLLTAVTVVATVAAVRIDDARRDANDMAAAEAAAKDVAQRDRDAARRAEREGKEKLLQALTAEAKASRFSRRIGQRYRTLDAVRKATALARELERPAATFDELRNLAAAALALPDLTPDSAWIVPPTDLDAAWINKFPDPTWRRMAFKHQSGVVSIRRIGTGPDDCGEIARLPGLGVEPQLGWSADGRHLAVHHVTNKLAVLRVWRVGNESTERVFEVPTGCRGFAFPHAPTEVVLVEEEAAPPARLRLRIRDLWTGRVLRSWPLEGSWVGSVAAHPSRAEVAVVLAGCVAVIDLATGSRIAALPAAGAKLVAWHPHGELLAVAFEHHVEVWDVARGRRNVRVEHPGDGVHAFFNPAGDVMVTCGWTSRLRLWNPYTGEKLLETVGWAQFGGANRLSSRFPEDESGPAGPLMMFAVGGEYRTLPVGTGASGVHVLTTCSLHPQGRLLAVSSHPGVSLIDLPTGSERAFLRTSSPCRDVLFESDGSLLVKTSADVRRHAVATDPAHPDRMSVGPPELVPVSALGESVARSDDGTVLAASDPNNGAVVWRRDRPYDALRLSHADCRHVTVSPNGQLVATGSWHGRGVRVWEAGTGELVRELASERGTLIPTFSGDGRWLVESLGRRWRVGDWTEGGNAPTGTTRVGFSRTDRLAAWGWKGFIVLTDPESGRELVRLEDPHQDGLYSLEFSPDGRFLFGSSVDSTCVRVWDLWKIRTGLAGLGLDWAETPIPPLVDAGRQPLQVTTSGAADDPVRMRHVQRAHAIVALWVDPFDAEARLALGDALLSLDRVRGAEAQLTAALALRPDQAGGYRLRSLLHGRKGEWEQCASDAGEALKRSVRQPELQWYRGVALARLGRYAEALPNLTSAVDHYGQDVAKRLERGDAYRALGRATEAAADWSRAADLAWEGLSGQTLNNLAWRLLTAAPRTRDPENGMRLAKMAHEKAKEDRTVSRTLGVAYYRDGRFKEAISKLKPALLSGQDTAYVWFVMAACYAKLEDRERAEEAYRLAVRWADAQANLDVITAGELEDIRREAEIALGAPSVARHLAPPPREIVRPR